MPSKSRAVDSDKVWASLITNTSYLTGLLTLAYSLRRAGTSYPLVALYTDAFPASGIAALDARGIPHQRIPHLLPSKGKDFSEDPRFFETWSKLATFSVTDYSRIVLLDSDMLVLKNMDELMDLELDGPEATKDGKGKRVFAASPACACNPLNRPHYPKNWIPENCAYTTQHPHPDAAQTTAPASPLGDLNSGLLTINPSEKLYSQILARMDDDVTDMIFPDQELLADVYRGRWVPLPYIYNALKTLRWRGVHDSIWRDDEVKNVHYILSPKPWDEVGEDGVWTGTEESHKWWVDMDKERRKSERDAGVPEDEFNVLR